MGQKHSKFGPISVDFKVRRRISSERMKIYKIVYRDFFRVRRDKTAEVRLNYFKDIQNWTVLLCIAIPPALGKTSPVKFGQVILEI